jgi:hypothetical protein
MTATENVVAENDAGREQPPTMMTENVVAKTAMNNNKIYESIRREWLDTPMPRC